MERNNKSSLIYGLVLILIAFLVIVAVFLMSDRSPRSDIQLPDEAPQVTDQTNFNSVGSNGFVQITVDNVLSVVETLHRPKEYQQTVVVSYGEEPDESDEKITCVTNGAVYRADFVRNGGTETLLTDGSTAWLWHSDDKHPVSVSVNGTVTIDDLMAIPTYELLLKEDPAKIVNADYVVLQDPLVQCVYVSVEEDDILREYWIELQTGLLFQATVTNEDQTVYSVYQESFELLSPEDEIFVSAFTLPDGSAPFSVE